MDSITQILRGLTPEQRMGAKEKAKELTRKMIGTKPTIEQFRQRRFGKYPAWVFYLTVALIIAVIITAFLPSAMRLNHIGYGEFYQAIQDGTSAHVAGGSIVLLAELSAILFTIALSVLTENWFGKTILISLAILSTTIALSGNYFVALHGRDINLFTVLEALAPPIITIGASYILKGVIFKSIEQHHEETQAFEDALDEWEDKTSSPEQHPDFMMNYAIQLKTAIFKANSDGRVKYTREDGIKERVVDLLHNLTDDEWRVLIQRELRADSWLTSFKQQERYEEPETTKAVGSEAARQPGFLPAPLPASQLQN